MSLSQSIMFLQCVAVLLFTRSVLVFGLQPLSSYGEDCGPKLQCDEEAGMVCRNGTCGCPTGYVVSSDWDTCLKGRSLAPAFITIQVYGESCNEDQRCDVDEGMTCQQNVCACQRGSVVSNNRERCLPEARTLHDPCEEDVQCDSKLGVHTTCLHGVCRCKKYAVSLHGTCLNRTNYHQNV